MTTDKSLTKQGQSGKAAKQGSDKTGVEARLDALLDRAKVAREKYLKLDQETINRISKAMALAGQAAHMELARMAVEETGRGILEDKVTKNIFLPNLYTIPSSTIKPLALSRITKKKIICWWLNQ